MNVTEFIAKWKKTALKESSAAHEHFLDLCSVFDHPTPAAADPKGEVHDIPLSEFDRPRNLEIVRAVFHNPPSSGRAPPARRSPPRWPARSVRSPGPCASAD